MKTTSTLDIINFLKNNQKNYEEELIKLIDSSNCGVYYINENKMYFSSEAKNIFNIDESITFNEFLKNVNFTDRKLLANIETNNYLPSVENIDKQFSYEIDYRYKVDHDKVLWIKEHGIFNYHNKLQRLAIVTNNSKQVEQEKLLHKLAYYDSITDLKNRNYFQKDASYLINYNIPFALFLLDINSFKLINDNFGHSLGDYVLKSFSNVLTNCIKYTFDFDVYRLSGDEFFIIFPYLESKDEAEKILNQINDAFNMPLIVNEYNLRISPSIGISFFPNDTENLQTLINYADVSMYRAKASSFYKYSFFDINYYNNILEEKSIEEHIKYLIENKLIDINFQPIYDINANKVMSFEALFNSKSKYSPDKIFNTALKSHLIVSLDKYIIELVIKTISEYKFNSDICFTINVTPKTIEYIDIYEIIKNLLEKYNVSGHHLGIEITEQYFINDDNKLNNLIKKLKSLGIKIYLDDFGMGYSSVRYLTYLTYDHLKIDRRMISTVFDNKKCEVFLKNIIKFAEDIGCDIIFEGVENEKQYNFIKSIGGSLIQGYYYCKPIEIKEAIKLLKL